MTVAIVLLEGPEREITSQVRVAVYDALRFNIRHDNQLWGFGGLENVARFTFRGMKDESREVRHSAG